MGPFLKALRQRSDLRPFFIGQVTLIAQPAAVIAGAVLLGPHGMPPKIAAGAGNGNGISGFKTNPLTDSNVSVCSRTDTKGTDAWEAHQIFPFGQPAVSDSRGRADGSRSPMRRKSPPPGVRHGYLRHLAAVNEPQLEVSK